MTLLDSKTKILLEKRKLIWDSHYSVSRIPLEIQNALNSGADQIRPLLPPPNLGEPLPSSIKDELDSINSTVLSLNEKGQLISSLSNEIASNSAEIKNLQSKIQIAYIVIAVVVAIALLIIFL